MGKSCRCHRAHKSVGRDGGEKCADEGFVRERSFSGRGAIGGCVNCGGSGSEHRGIRGDRLISYSRGLVSGLGIAGLGIAGLGIAAM